MEAIFTHKMPLSGHLPASKPLMSASMVLLELLCCLLDKLVARDDRFTDPRYRCSIDDRFNLSQ